MKKASFLFVLSASFITAANANDMTFEQFLDRASGECYDWININTELYCPCFGKRLKETATEKEKQLYINNWALLDWNRADKLDEWLQGEEGREFFKYKKDISDYCRKILNK